MSLQLDLALEGSVRPAVQGCPVQCVCEAELAEGRVHTTVAHTVLSGLIWGAEWE